MKTRRDSVKQVVLAVTDTETTGGEETDQVCEMAVVLVDPVKRAERKPRFRWSSLIRPTCPMSSVGRAAHHISDAELADKWTMAEMLKERGLPEYGRCPQEEEIEAVFAAHNAEFDLQMLLQSGVPQDFLPKRVICTYKCARHLWPKAPKFSNQVLRYWLDVDVPKITSLPPHRALPDVMVTQAILCRMLEEKTVDELVELTSTPILIETCTLGEQAGKLWSEVPVDFLQWLLSKGPRRPNPRGGRDIGFDDDTRHTAQHWLNQKTAQINAGLRR